jgi:M-phase inducer tyrosine phosphatase
MYESPGDIINQDKESSTSSTVLQSVMDVDDTPALKLPHFVPANEPDSTPRISDTTLINVLNGDFSHIYNKIVIVDCRFEYEYKGGHIDGAINFCDKERLAEELFDQPSPPNTLLIFHCEYSAHRAPLMYVPCSYLLIFYLTNHRAKFVRGRDRSINEESYPHLTYPEVYILEGGYSSFYESHRSRCIGHYLRMDAKEHESACERGMNKLRQRTKLNRAQTFAFGQQTFGQQSCQMEDSPTANSRSKTGGILPMGMETDNCFNLGRVGTRRMASY